MKNKRRSVAGTKVLNAARGSRKRVIINAEGKVLIRLRDGKTVGTGLKAIDVLNLREGGSVKSKRCLACRHYACRAPNTLELHLSLGGRIDSFKVKWTLFRMAAARAGFSL